MLLFLLLVFSIVHHIMITMIHNDSMMVEGLLVI